jgi:shikimate dehydrogenase
MAARTGKAQLVGILGQPVTHSLSPVIHEHWFTELALDAAYIPLRHAPGDFHAALQAIRSLDMRGFNVTVPYKSEILPHLDSIDPAAQAIGAVNTVIITQGRWHGVNTDGTGYLRHLRDSVTDTALCAGLEDVLVLGAGGGARAIVAAMLGAGAGRITVCNRSDEKAHALINHMQPLSGHASLHALPWEKRHMAVQHARVLINTTSLGMTGHAPLPVTLESMPVGGIVSDIVYAPLETPLLAEARVRGLVAVDGLGMLLGQAAEAFAAWFGVQPEISETLRRRVMHAREDAA